jgi:hypothetical protein
LRILLHFRNPHWSITRKEKKESCKKRQSDTLEEKVNRRPDGKQITKGEKIFLLTGQGIGNREKKYSTGFWKVGQNSEPLFMIRKYIIY